MKYRVWLAAVIGTASVTQAQGPEASLPAGTKALRDLEYVKGGHERDVLHVWHVDSHGHDATEWGNNLYLFAQRLFK